MADTKDFLGSGWAFPVQVVGGKVAMAAGELDIRQAIGLILDTAFGERLMRPDFGCAIQELVFAAQNETTYHLAAHYVQKALAEWEPRIEVEAVRAARDPARAAVLLISIDYVIRSKNQRANLVYPFYLTQG